MLTWVLQSSVSFLHTSMWDQKEEEEKKKSNRYWRRSNHSPCVVTHFLFATKFPLCSTIEPWRQCFGENKIVPRKRDVNTSETWHVGGVAPRTALRIKRRSSSTKFFFFSPFAVSPCVFPPHVRFPRRWSAASVVWRRTTGCWRVTWRRWLAGAVCARTNAAGRKTRWFIATATAATSPCTKVSY